MQDRTPEEIYELYQRTAKRAEKGPAFSTFPKKVKESFSKRLDGEAERLEKTGRISEYSTDWAAYADKLGFEASDARKALDAVHRLVVERNIERRKTDAKPKEMKEMKLQQYLLKEGLAELEPGLTVIGDELQLIKGRADIVAKYKDGKVIVENKGPDWNSRNRSNRIEIHYEVDFYSNELRKRFPNEHHKTILFLPNYGLDLHDCLEDHVAKGSLTVYTYAEKDGKYLFEKVDFGEYEDMIATKIARGETFKKVEWPRKPKTQSAGAPDGLAINELVPRYTGTVKRRSKPVAAETGEGHPEKIPILPLEEFHATTQKVTLEKSRYTALEQLKENSDLSMMLKELENVPENNITSGPLWAVPDFEGPKANALKIEYGRLQHEYEELRSQLRRPYDMCPDDQKFMNRIISPEEYPDYIRHIKKLVSDNAAALEAFVRKAKRSKVYEVCDRMRKRDADVLWAVLADGLLCIVDRTEALYWLDILTKTEKLSELSMDTAIDYLDETKNKFDRASDYKTYLDFANKGRQIYEKILESSFEVVPDKKTIVNDEVKVSADPKIETNTKIEETEEQPYANLRECVLPAKYASRLPDYIENRVKNFIEDVGYLNAADKDKLALAFKPVKWYKGVPNGGPGEIPFYAFLDYVTADIRNGVIPTKEQIESYFQKTSGAKYLRSCVR